MLTESNVSFSISSLVRLDLGTPPCSIVFRPSAMDGAAVPKTTVDKNSHSRTDERDIRLSTRTWESPMETISKSSSVQL
jgi:hypothetical protein